MSDQPIQHCYWVVPHQLLAGEYPRNLDEQSSRAKVDALVAAGVRVFIDLTEDADGLLSYDDLLEGHQDRGVWHQRFPVRDRAVPHSPAFTGSILDAIDAAISQGRMVYVHCWGGIGRTGTIVGCWLVRQGHTGPAALLKLAELWQRCPKSPYAASPETPAQEQYIREWQETR